LQENENDFIDLAAFKEVISKISEEFHTRLNDFDSLKPKLQLFSNSMDIEVNQQPFDLRIKVCDLQSDLFSIKIESPEGLENATSREVHQDSKVVP
jgi:hypothetical protein